MSKKHFVFITLNQIKEVLKEEKGWVMKTEPTSREYFFEFPLKNIPWIVIRVASSITEMEIGRPRGKDAIMVYALDTKNNKGYIKTKRVYRIVTWKDNLQKTVMDCFRQAKERRNRENLA